MKLKFDFIGVAIGVARIFMMISSGCGGHSSGVTRVVVVFGGGNFVVGVRGTV